MASRPFAMCSIDVDSSDKSTNVIKPTTISRTDIRASSRRKVGLAVCLVFKGKKVKEHTAVNGTPSDSYGVSLAVWDHTVLPSTRHK